MVLLAGPGPEGGGALCAPPQPPSPPRAAKTREAAAADYEEFEDFSRLPDARSIASDDSFYPAPDPEEERGAPGADGGAAPEAGPEGAPEAASLLRAAGANDVRLLRALVRRGPREEEVRETDPNGRTGLIVACHHGFVDAVVVLAECPHVDVNWQDSEGNTALITAAQAGHATITNYLLNYFPGLDLERRNVFGFTALMKAAMQGRTECIRALMLAGADVHARDPRRGMSPQEWATYTGRKEAVRLIGRLLERPRPEQFGDKYRPELPLPPEGAPKPGSSTSCLQRLAELVRSALASRPRQGPADGGVLDHMVRVTTGLRSPAVAVACRTVCPEDPPCVGKRRLAVQEILEAPAAQDRDQGEEEPEQQQFRTSGAAGAPGEGAPRASPAAPRKASVPAAPGKASVPAAPGKASVPAAPGKASVPAAPRRRSSARPGPAVPRVRITKAPAPTFQPERAPAKGGAQDSSHLQLPKWRYKEAREERRRAEEAEKQRAAAAQKGRRAAPWRKRT